MQINVREDSIEVEGYVNAVERKSKVLRSRLGRFIERIKQGAFKRAIERNDNVRLLLNHDPTKDLGGTKDGNLSLLEDNIGLKMRATVTDAETVEKGKNGDLIGFSFGFRDVPDGVTESVEDGIKVRDVNDLELIEISILDRRKTPAYEGNLISVRSDDEIFYSEEMIAEEIRNEPEQEAKPVEIDYSKWDEMIKDMREGK